MKKPHVIVVGAGAFGGWTALYLLRQGARVTLLDAWGPGNSRASSGGETRIIRGTYGPNQPYTKMTARAFELWDEHEAQWKKKFMQRCGVLWLVCGDGVFERASLPTLREAGIAYEEWTPATISKRYPQINVEDVKWAIFEPGSGYLFARRSCHAVVEGFVAEGGEFKLGAVASVEISGGETHGVRLEDGSHLQAGSYVFACGPWLGKLFPEVIGQHIRATRQDVVFFGVPHGDARFTEEYLPVWADHGEHFIYGIPGSITGDNARGFKFADDTRGEEFDPTAGDRTVRPEFIRAAKQYLAHRFPAMKDAPVVETRVCQYENTPDNHFIIDRHPQAQNCWIVGGGSGHGFKHGPALGEMMTPLVLRNGAADAVFRLERFQR